MEILLKSLVSAIATAAILLLSKYVDPKLAGALGGIPIVFAVSYVLLIMNEKAISREFLEGGIYGAIAAIFFSLALIWLNVKFPKAYWLNFIAAYALCFLLVLTFYTFFKPSKI